jgi:hypothetical protein
MPPLYKNTAAAFAKGGDWRSIEEVSEVVSTTIIAQFNYYKHR